LNAPLRREADIERDVGQRCTRIREQRKRHIQPQAMQIAMRRLAERFVE
jgi:hypothetical protein